MTTDAVQAHLGAAEQVEEQVAVRIYLTLVQHRTSHS
jgi:hypothetical protein